MRTGLVKQRMHPPVLAFSAISKFRQRILELPETIFVAKKLWSVTEQEMIGTYPVRIS